MTKSPQQFFISRTSASNLEKLFQCTIYDLKPILFFLVRMIELLTLSSNILAWRSVPTPLNVRVALTVMLTLLKVACMSFTACKTNKPEKE